MTLLLVARKMGRLTDGHDLACAVELPGRVLALARALQPGLTARALDLGAVAAFPPKLAPRRCWRSSTRPGAVISRTGPPSLWPTNATATASSAAISVWPPGTRGPRACRDVRRPWKGLSQAWEGPIEVLADRWRAGAVPTARPRSHEHLTWARRRRIPFRRSAAARVQGPCLTRLFAADRDRTRKHTPRRRAPDSTPAPDSPFSSDGVPAAHARSSRRWLSRAARARGPRGWRGAVAAERRCRDRSPARPARRATCSTPRRAAG